MSVVVAVPGQGLSLPPIGPDGSIIVSDGSEAAWTTAPVIKGSLTVLTAGTQQISMSAGVLLASSTTSVPKLGVVNLQTGARFGTFEAFSTLIRIGATSSMTPLEVYADNVLRLKFDGTTATMFSDLVFDNGTRLVGTVANQDILDKTAAETITGVYTHEAPLIVSPVVGATSATGLTMGSNFTGGTAFKGAPIYTLGSLVSSDVAIPAGNYGTAQGLDINVVNTNTTKAGAGKGHPAPYALSVVQSHNMDVLYEAITMISGVLSTNAATTNLASYAQKMVVNVDTSSTGVTGGGVGCFFQANQDHLTGSCTGVVGWAQANNPAATGIYTGAWANLVNFGGGTATLTGLKVDFVSSLDSSYQYALRSQNGHIMLRGGLWLTTETSLIGSNPSNHLPISTGAAANQVLFVKEDAEIQGKLWLESDLEHTAAAGNIGVFGTTAIGQRAQLVQNYATADRTLNAYTADDESVAYTGAADGEAKLVDLNALRVAYENLRALAEDLAQFVNAMADDQQAFGWVAP